MSLYPIRPLTPAVARSERARRAFNLDQVAQTLSIEPFTEIQVLGEGSTGRAYAAQHSDLGPVVVKAYRYAHFAKSEVESLKFLSTNLGGQLKVPSVYHHKFYSEQKDALDVVVMEYIEGQSAARLLSEESVQLSHEEVKLLVCEAAQTLHSVNFEGAGGAGEWKDSYRQRIELVRKAMQDFDKVGDWKFGAAVHRLAETACQCFDTIFDTHHPTLSLVHGDLGLDHFMMDQNSGKIQGILDPLESRWGDREEDLLFWNMYRPDLSSMYFKKIKNDDELRQIDLRLRYHAFWHVMKVQCLIGHLSTDGLGRVEPSAAALSEVFDELGIVN